VREARPANAKKQCTIDLKLANARYCIGEQPWKADAPSQNIYFSIFDFFSTQA